MVYLPEELAEPCSYCNAEPGQWCTKPLAGLRDPHMVRRRNAAERSVPVQVGADHQDANGQEQDHD